MNEKFPREDGSSGGSKDLTGLTARMCTPWGQQQRQWQIYVELQPESKKDATRVV